MRRLREIFRKWWGIARLWFELTGDEQKTAVLILALFLLGLTVRFWHLQKKTSDANLVQEIAQCATTRKAQEGKNVRAQVNRKNH